MSETLLSTKFGDYHIKRIPHRKKETLRAWDASDIQLLNTLYDLNADLSAGVLLVNDIFASLSVSLNEYQPMSWSDSWISHQALRENINLNGLHDAKFQTIDSLHPPKSTVKVVVMKIPKSMALFEDQLLRLKPFLTEDSVVLMAGMIKYLPKKVWLLIESIIGKASTHLTLKKAKVIEVLVDVSLPSRINPYPLSWDLENTTNRLSNHSNVFSREHLDMASRLFLEHLPQIKDDQSIVDLGCGNGVIGLTVALQNSNCEVLLVDESYMAIASAKENLKHIKNPDRIKFHCGDGLLKVKKKSAHIILCNPPCHQHHANGETVALMMFSQASRVLKKYGALWIVANRHLAYHSKLTTWFMDVVMVASNKSFVVLKASNPKDFTP